MVALGRAWQHRRGIRAALEGIDSAHRIMIGSPQKHLGHFAPQPDVGRGERTPSLLAWICENTYRRPPSQSPCHHASVFRDHVGTLERPSDSRPNAGGPSFDWRLVWPQGVVIGNAERPAGRLRRRTLRERRVTGSFARTRTPPEGIAVLERRGCPLLSPRPLLHHHTPPFPFFSRTHAKATRI